jgi:P27 family predicted phage terminase small subunit
MGKRGIHTKPTQLRIIEGNRTGKPFNTREPMPAPAIPVPPKHLEPEALKEWNRLAEELFMLGLLTNLDRGALAAVCAAWARWVAAEEALNKLGRPLLYKTTNGNWIQHPLIGTANRAAVQYVRLSAEFGMSPSARANISALTHGNSTKPKDPAQAYF